MSIRHDFKLTGEQVADIFNNRLRPYLPAYLEKVDPHTYHITYTFKPFTGRETQPEQPSFSTYSNDPKLSYKHQDEKAGRPIADDAEYDLREAALFLLSDVYRAALIDWRNAHHIAELKNVVKNTGDLWKQYGQARSAVDAAFAYLRDPKAAKEWATAISRLIDTHDALKTAATAFDDRAEQIAEVNEKHFHEDGYGSTGALKIAGFPEADDWEIHDSADYKTSWDGSWSEWDRCLQAQASRLIKAQEEHVAKVGRLSGTASHA